jgi:Mediator complex subunit 29
MSLLNLILFPCSKGNESTTQRFDKNLEEFYSYCDQMELNLVSSNILQALSYIEFMIKFVMKYRKLQ